MPTEAGVTAFFFLAGANAFSLSIAEILFVGLFFHSSVCYNAERLVHHTALREKCIASNEPSGFSAHRARRV